VRADNPDSPSGDPDHRAVAALGGDEVEDVRGDDLDRVLVDDREERLQIMGDRPQRVRPRPTGHERQVRINQRVTQREASLPASTRGSDQARERVHPHMLPTASEMHGDPDGSSVY
jgi:hypothetical protein